MRVAFIALVRLDSDLIFRCISMMTKFNVSFTFFIFNKKIKLNTWELESYNRYLHLPEGKSRRWRDGGCFSIKAARFFANLARLDENNNKLTDRAEQKNNGTAVKKFVICCFQFVGCLTLGWSSGLCDSGGKYGTLAWQIGQFQRTERVFTSRLG